ncbi:Phosphoadenosine phosphosulfate reductase; AltName: Full=3'-phosphoadenylylsulfate reductase; AltName: Full=PAPS reductase, thioredoxin dependent; AltName: Full=PAdoPS reductase [Serendipita indica DSM 11827]|nr:Phosphoadenosine phosphosulfate reductase; AltName: Full=3'-phosphoadenylylsulfate reductase; AltName: Full=PAPS reductase, thioredoxin dependent; AltName: Full=PAdoPS reductase [Serendipita indica DSM 11827]
MPVEITPVDISLQGPIPEEQLALINAHLSLLTPYEVLQWGVDHLPGLFQTTAFGLTGLVGIDMLSKMTSSPPPLIFLDTLYHFQETLDLVEQVRNRYGIQIAVYRPEGCETIQDFELKYGERLWEVSEEVYDYAVKVEPAQRAYRELGVRSIITGRRASQGAARATLQPLEIDSTGIFKLNPFVSWSFSQVKAYIDEHNVPRNALLDQGYKSVGDWHSTQKSGEGDAGERAGRWAGRDKTECGLHKDYFKMKLAAKKKQHEEELQSREEALEKAISLDTPIAEVIQSSA